MNLNLDQLIARENDYEKQMGADLKKRQVLFIEVDEAFGKVNGAKAWKLVLWGIFIYVITMVLINYLNGYKALKVHSTMAPATQSAQLELVLRPHTYPKGTASATFEVDRVQKYEIGDKVFISINGMPYEPFTSQPIPGTSKRSIELPARARNGTVSYLCTDQDFTIYVLEPRRS